MKIRSMIMIIVCTGLSYGIGNVTINRVDSK